MFEVKNLLSYCLLLLPAFLVAQDTTDVTFLRELSYMQDFADRVDCEDWADNLSHRVCLNKEFQLLDSTMNQHLKLYWQEVENDSLLQLEQQYHQSWVEHRRRVSRAAAEGSRGHLLGIIYLSTMNEITRQRIVELHFLLGAD